MPRIQTSILDFTYDPDVAKALVDKWNQDNSSQLADATKEELLAIADDLLHMSHFCIVAAERK
jgi:hypothetical protein